MGQERAPLSLRRRGISELRTYLRSVPLMCFFHSWGPLKVNEAEVFYIGGASGARPYHPATKQCEKCGLEVATETRAEGPGLVP